MLCDKNIGLAKKIIKLVAETEGVLDITPYNVSERLGCTWEEYQYYRDVLADLNLIVRSTASDRGKAIHSLTLLGALLYKPNVFEDD